MTDDGQTVSIPKSEYEALLADRQLLEALESTLRTALAALARRPDLDLAALAPGAAEEHFGLPPVPPNPGHGGTGSRIDDDPEVAAFIRQRLGKVPLPQIAAECRDRFGPDRAPSKSAIHRYWQRQNRH